jgi:hypothetical protein
MLHHPYQVCSHLVCKTGCNDITEILLLDKGINVLMFYHNFKLELSPIAGYFCSSFIMVGVAKSYGILMQLVSITPRLNAI